MAKKVKLWTEGEWKGMKTFKCNKCAFDTLHLATIEEHVKIHMPKPKVKPTIIKAYDRFGKEVKEGFDGKDNSNEK